MRVGSSSQAPAADAAGECSVRVLLADSLAATRFAAKVVLQGFGATLCGEADSAPAARALCEQARPDIIIFDVRLERGSGLSLLQEFRSLVREAKLVVWTEDEAAETVQRAFRLGAAGFLSKCADPGEIQVCLKALAAGTPYTASRLVSSLQFVRAIREPKVHAGVATLSEREFCIFSLLGRKYGPTAIARQLGVSVKTIETHLQHIKLKLNVQTALTLQQIALAWAVSNDDAAHAPAGVGIGAAPRKNARLLSDWAVER